MDALQATVAIPPDVLDSLCSRFLINIPAEGRNSMIRVFFQIELAHWFYIDFYKAEKHYLPGCSIKEFSKAIFRHCPFLKEYRSRWEEHFANWKEYKRSVPTYGAIMLDSTLQNIVLVQSFFSKTNWGFPKGKVNEGELPKHCAIREVLEETGFDITGLIDEEEYIEATFNDQLARLYVVPNVPVDTDFKPKTRGEIKDIQWFHIDDLPTNKKDNAPKVNLGLNPNNFFMAIPYMKTLKKKVGKRKGTKETQRMESPLAALTKLTQPITAVLQQQTVAGAQQLPNGSGAKQKAASHAGVNGTTEPRPASDHRHKMKQQRAFNSQNQSQTEVYLRLRDPQQQQQQQQDGGRRQHQGQHGRGSPSSGQARGKGQVNGNVSPQKQYQILSRNQPKSMDYDIMTDSLAVTDEDQVNERRSLTAPAFANFRLDTSALMRAFDTGLSGRNCVR